MTAEVCPDCGEEFGAVWVVTFGSSEGYTPLFPAGHRREMARCDHCAVQFERGDGGWRPHPA